jgi:hypothetical protein
MGMRRIAMVRARLFAAVFLLAGLCVPAYAQRSTALSASVDLVGGLDSNPGGNVIGTTTQANGFYSVYPALSITNRGSRSTLDLTYAFGWNQFQSELPRHSTTHTVSLAWSRNFSSRWNMTLGESFSQSDDLYSFYALRGVALVEEQLVFVFAPVATEQTVRSNRLSIAVNHDISPRSTLSFHADHTMGIYEDAGTGTGLSDQYYATAGATYSRKVSERTSWEAGFTATRFGFDRFNGATSNVVHVGVTRVLAKDTSLRLTVGPSYVRHAGPDGANLGYQATASLTKAIERNSFHASFAQDNAMSTGLGSVSTTRTASAGFSRAFNRRVSGFADFSAFDGRAYIGNVLNSRGLSATGNVSVTLAKNLSLQGGVTFLRYSEPAPYAVTQKRVFVSLRYTQPDLLR